MIAARKGPKEGDIKGIQNPDPPRKCVGQHEERDERIPSHQRHEVFSLQTHFPGGSSLYTTIMLPSSEAWCELRRIPLPRTSVNKGIEKAGAATTPRPSNRHTPLQSLRRSVLEGVLYLAAADRVEPHAPSKFLLFSTRSVGIIFSVA